MVKKICKKDCGDTVYELVCFEGDNKFVIYKIDKKKVKNTEIQEIPEIATFENEKEAREYFDKLS